MALTVSHLIQWEASVMVGGYGNFFAYATPMSFQAVGCSVGDKKIRPIDGWSVK